MSLFCCPLCGRPLARRENSLFCENRHCFDFAREGYVNLLPVGQKHSKAPGDDPKMVAARSQFLGADYYLPLRRALEKAVRALCADRLHPLILDCGCGEGYYTVGVYRALSEMGAEPRAAGFDISKFALKKAAKRLPEGEFAVASVHKIPLTDSCADVLLNVFSPMDAGEMARVLRPGGSLLYVVPGPRHLWELKEILYEHPYENERKAVFYPGFAERETVPVEYTIHLKTPQAIEALFSMTPYAWKTPRQGREALVRLKSLTTQVSFDIHRYLCPKEEAI